MPEFGSHALPPVSTIGFVYLICHSTTRIGTPDSIVPVLRPLGDLIYVQKREESSLQYLRVLARLRKAISFLMEIIIEVGVRSLRVLLEDLGTQVIRSRIVQTRATNPNPNISASSQRKSVNPPNSGNPTRNDQL